MIRIGLQWFLTQTGLGASTHLESGGFARSNNNVKNIFILIKIYLKKKILGETSKYSISLFTINSA